MRARGIVSALSASSQAPETNKWPEGKENGKWTITWDNDK
jgi:hypothetical protein